MSKINLCSISLVQCSHISLYKWLRIYYWDIIYTKLKYQIDSFVPTAVLFEFYNTCVQ
jgi:hypothetical protein